MTWPTLTPILKIALNSTPDTEPGGGDWTDLSSRIVGDVPWTVTAGRSDVLDAFQPGRLEVVLDNSDRMLDPSNPSGLVYAADGEGLPLCWVTFDLSDGTTTERRFTGFLASPAWEGSGTPRYAGLSRDNTVTLVAEDRLAWSPEYPSEAWHVMIKALTPDWWLPMDPAFPVLVNGSSVPNRAGGGGNATVIESDSNLTRVSDDLGSYAPNLKFSANHKLKSAAADVMPDGDEMDLTACMWWRLTTGTHGTGESSTVLNLTSPGGSTKRFDLVINDAGDAVATWYDSGGSSLDSVTISRPGGRWDSNLAVFVVVRWDSGNVCDVWVNGVSDGTTIATSTVYQSDWYIGPSDNDPVVDEFVVWRRALTDDEVAGLNLTAGSSLNPWDGNNWLGDGGRGSRVDNWFRAAGLDPDVDDTNQWHLPVDDTDQGFFGLGTVSNIPSNLAEALRAMVGPNGAVWANREGYLRVRTVEALDDATYAFSYVTATAELTDDAGSLSGIQVRHAGVQLSGVDVETVINRAAVSFTHIDEVGPPRVTSNMAIRPEGTTLRGGKSSVKRFGVREKAFSLDWYGYERAASLADALIARYQWPVPAIESVVVDCTTAAAASWFQTFELENAVDVTYHPDGGSAVTVEGLQIQRFAMSGTSRLVRCEFMLAKS